ncbi:MAG: succinyl-diaminopimelate desuccinylase [Pseudomonadota bacterium]
MNPRDPVALTQALVQCQSVTPDEGGALQLLDDVLCAAGFDVHRLTFSDAGTPDVENLYARIGSAAPNLCFAGHTDVVPAGDPAAWTHPPFAADISDGVLFGRGAVDMKGAVAAFVSAALTHLDANGGAPKSGSVSLLITGDEEGPAINGTTKVLDWLKQRGETLDMCLVGEPTNPKALGDEIKIGRRGSLNAELVIKGRQGHAAYPHLADNPVPKLASIIAAISGPLDDGVPHFAPTNLEVSVISSATTVTNVIPAEARAAFNVRYNTGFTRAALEDHLRRRIADLTDDLGVADHTLTFSGTGDAFLTSPGPWVSQVSDAVQAATGRAPELTTSGGTSDARFIQAHCPVVEFGLTNATIHAVDEHTDVSDIKVLSEIYRGILDRTPSDPAALRD